MQLKQLTEADVRRIVKDEMDNNYRSGTPKVPRHEHNGRDNIKISLANIDGFNTIPKSNTPNVNDVYYYASPYLLETTDSIIVNNLYNPDGSTNGDENTVFQNDKIKFTLPVPVIFGTGGFNGGAAPVGTIILTKDGSNNLLLAVSYNPDGGWGYVQLTPIT